jgi:outer membrane protein assembly factor BamB
MKKQGLFRQFLLFIILLSFCLNSCSQTGSGMPQRNDNRDTIKLIRSGFEEMTDTSFTFESRNPVRFNFDSLTFFTGVEDSSGIYTYRGSNQRNSPVRGRLLSRPSELADDWIFSTGSDTTKGIYGVWGGGAGWTGQPLYTEWSPEEQKTLEGVADPYKGRDTLLKEIVQVSLCGKVYFIDFETGKQTRKPLIINNPVKGTPSIDGSNKKYLLVGQGIQNRGYFGWRVFDLRKQTLLHVEPMPSPFAYKMWGACDATPLVESKSGTFVWPTESGVIYRGLLDKGKIDSTELYRYSFPEHPRQGIESSPSVYKYLGYFTDNAGNVFCLDLRTMKPRWHFFNTDDTDGTPVIEIEKDTPYVYIGNEVDLQGSKGKAYLRKLNGLNGSLVWQYERECYSVTKPKTDNGGMLTTPVIGINKAKGLIWTSFSRTDIYGRGAFVCVNDSDGTLKYEIKLTSYSWVSPVALYDKEGNAYLYFSDVGGNIYLVDGATGEIIFRKKLDYIFESSPIAVGNRIIQPARGNRILSFIIK